MKHSAKSMVMKREFRSRVVKDKTKYNRNKSYDDADVPLTGDDEPVARNLIPDKYQNGYWEWRMKMHNKIALVMIVIMGCVWYISLLDYGDKVLWVLMMQHLKNGMI